MSNAQSVTFVFASDLTPELKGTLDRITRQFWFPEGEYDGFWFILKTSAASVDVLAYATEILRAIPEEGACAYCTAEWFYDPTQVRLVRRNGKVVRQEAVWADLPQALHAEMVH